MSERKDSEVAHCVSLLIGRCQSNATRKFIVGCENFYMLVAPRLAGFCWCGANSVSVGLEASRSWPI